MRIDKGIIIQRAQRTKRNYKDKDKKRPRTIVLRLANFKDKSIILKNVNKLEGSDVYINQDFSRETTELRKNLWDEKYEKNIRSNRRSMKKDFEIFQEFLKDLKFNFSAICLSETWCESIDATKIPIRNLMDIDLFTKLGTSAKDKGSVLFYVNLTLIN